MIALAVLSLLAGRAVATAEANGLSAEPLAGIVHMALGRALTRQGSLARAQEQLEWSLELFAIDGMALHRAYALLLAAVRHDREDLAGTRRLLGNAHDVSVNTVRSQVQAVYRKLEVTGRAEAVSEARRLGLLPGPGPAGDDDFT